jgi:hypothetical protein
VRGAANNVVFFEQSCQNVFQVLTSIRVRIVQLLKDVALPGAMCVHLSVVVHANFCACECPFLRT